MGVSTRKPSTSTLEIRAFVIAMYFSCARNGRPVDVLTDSPDGPNTKSPGRDADAAHREVGKSKRIPVLVQCGHLRRMPACTRC